MQVVIVIVIIVVVVLMENVGRFLQPLHLMQSLTESTLNQGYPFLQASQRQELRKTSHQRTAEVSNFTFRI